MRRALQENENGENGSDLTSNGTRTTSLFPTIVVKLRNPGRVASVADRIRKRINRQQRVTARRRDETRTEPISSFPMGWILFYLHTFDWTGRQENCSFAREWRRLNVDRTLKWVWTVGVHRVEHCSFGSEFRHRVWTKSMDEVQLRERKHLFTSWTLEWMLWEDWSRRFRENSVENPNWNRLVEVRWRIWARGMILIEWDTEVNMEMWHCLPRVVRFFAVRNKW